MPENEQEFINKNVSITPETWQKIRDYASRPENRRAPGHQAGMILKEFFDNLESCESCSKLFSEGEEYFTDSEGVHLCKSCYKKQVES